MKNSKLLKTNQKTTFWYCEGGTGAEKFETSERHISGQGRTVPPRFGKISGLPFQFGPFSLSKILPKSFKYILC